jgi:hypothetical protein
MQQIFLPALVSQSLTRPQNSADIERSDQRMFKSCLLVSISAGLFASSVSSAKTVTENFAAPPSQSGWQLFGNINLFHWNSANQNLEVTWDSRETNSYFYLPLGTLLTRNDDFSIEFDLLLNDIASGIEPGKTGGLEIGFGLFNLANATSTNNMRGNYGHSPSIVEFDYFPHGFYDFGGTIYDSPATATPTFISTGGFEYAPTIFAPYAVELPTNLVVHVRLAFTAGNQTMSTLLTTNGSTFFQPPDVVLTDTNNSQFTASTDFRVDTFSISSYSSFGDDFDSVLAHGIVDNISVTFPVPIQNFAGVVTNGSWQGSFLSQSNWVYTLERTADFQTWTSVSPTLSGNATTLVLGDTNSLPEKAFYRVRATHQ